MSFVGCYTDQKARAMILIDIRGPNECKAYAVSMMYKYFALQYGAQCFVSNDYVSSTQYGLYNGATRWLGNDGGTLSGCQYGGCWDGFCNNYDGSFPVYGGGYTNAIYVLGDAPQVTPTIQPNVTYFGCYADDASTQAMEVLYNFGPSGINVSPVDCASNITTTTTTTITAIAIITITITITITIISL